MIKFSFLNHTVADSVTNIVPFSCLPGGWRIGAGKREKRRKGGGGEARVIGRRGFKILTEERAFFPSKFRRNEGFGIWLAGGNREKYLLPG